MKRLLAACLALFLAALASPASAQCSPQNVPANTVVGRLGVGSGPCQAIPFSALSANLGMAGNAIPGTVNARTTTYTALNTDCSNSVIALGGDAQYTLTVPAASTLPGCVFTVINTDDAIGSGGRGKVIAINGVTFPMGFLYPGQSFGLRNVNNVWQLLFVQNRMALPTGGPLFIYVGGAGANDNNDGLTTSNPKLTTCAALGQTYSDFLPRTGTFGVQVQLQADDSTDCHRGFAGFQGADSLSTVTIDGGGFTVGSNIAATDDTMHFYGAGADLLIQNIRMWHFNTNWAINLEDGMTLRIGDGVKCRTGATGGGGCILSQSGSTAVFVGTTYTVEGQQGSFAACSDHGRVLFNSGTISITAAIGFGTTTVRADHVGDCNFVGVTWALNGHAVTGTRWGATTLGLVDSGTTTPNSFFPGDANGAAATGGVGN